MTVTLIHRLGATRAYNLTHAAYCQGFGACACRPVQQVVQAPAPGSRGVGVKITPLPSPEPLTLRAHERRRRVPAAVLACPEIAAAVATHIIAVIEE